MSTRLFCGQVLIRKRQIQISRKLSQLVKRGSLYVHYPYCKRICPYCDFNKYVRSDIDEERFLRCLKKELRSYLCMFNIGQLTSVFLGGGTPSLARPSTIKRLLQEVKSNCLFSPDAEVTLEVNPTFEAINKLREFKQAGVNRISIGIQALNNADLKVLGRDHSVEQALQCFHEANRLFHGRVSIDIMFARPSQTVESWRQELENITSLNCNHVSLYQLTMKRYTPMGRLYKKGLLHLPAEEACAQMYEDAIEILESSSLKQYEVSNFATLDSESEHNLNYWKGGDYIGIGPGAHGRLQAQDIDHRFALVNAPVPEHWMDQVEEKGHGIRKSTLLKKKERCNEFLLLALRTFMGVQHEDFEKNIGWLLSDLMEEESLKNLLNTGYISYLPDRGLCVTKKGMRVLNSITTEICIAVEKVNWSR